MEGKEAQRAWPHRQHGTCAKRINVRRAANQHSAVRAQGGLLDLLVGLVKLGGRDKHDAMRQGNGSPPGPRRKPWSRRTAQRAAPESAPRNGLAAASARLPGRWRVLRHDQVPSRCSRGPWCIPPRWLRLDGANRALVRATGVAWAPARRMPLGKPFAATHRPRHGIGVRQRGPCLCRC